MIDVQELRSLIEAECARFEVPGAAVVVIADNEVVLSDGFGVGDIVTGQPVTNRTMFPIASNTKCFTAATLCILAEQGKVDLDAPVRDIIPWFRMHDPHATELVSCCDLLAHRTGLPAHDMMWYGEIPLSHEEVTRRLRFLAKLEAAATALAVQQHVLRGHRLRHRSRDGHDVDRRRPIDPAGTVGHGGCVLVCPRPRRK